MVDVANGEPLLTSVVEIRHVIGEWLSLKQFKNVRISEVLEPDNSDIDDVQTDYEVVFEPDSLSAARVEIWVLQDKYIEIHFDKIERVNKRFGLRSSHRGCVDLQWGHEMTRRQLVVILEEISGGHVWAKINTCLGFVLNESAAITEERKKYLEDQGYSNIEWSSGLYTIPECRSSMTKSYAFWKNHIVNYHPW